MNRATVVITGASAGVGRAAVRKFARHGARIGLLARGVDGLTAAQREVEKLGGEALVIPTDVANAEQVEAAAAAIEAQLGEIDIWINNAMTSVFSPIKQMTAEEFRRVTEVTYLGYVYGTLAALKRMLPRDRGVIVQVGSALAYRGIPLQAAYCAAKHAVQGFCDSLRCELIHDNSNVKVTMLQMPALNTPQFGWVKSRLAHKAQPVPPIFRCEQNRARLARSCPRPQWLRFPAIQRRGRSKSARQSMATSSRRSRRAWRIQRAREKLEPATMGQRASCLARDRCGGARHFRPSRVSQKQRPVAGIGDPGS